MSKLRPISAAATPLRDGGVQEPRAVEVHRQAGSRAAATVASQELPRPDLAAAAVVRVLEADNPRAREVRVVRVDRRRDRLGPEDAAGALDRLHGQARERRRASRLVAEDVRPGLGDDLVSGLGREPERDLVRHRRGRDEHGRLLPEQRRLRCSSSALTVGSSRFCSSPTSASAMARRMPGDGRVAVSERRSITRAIYGHALALLLELDVGEQLLLGKLRGTTPRAGVAGAARIRRRFRRRRYSAPT